MSARRVKGYSGDLDDHGSIEEALLFHSRLLAAVGEAVIATGVDGTITYWNRAAERLYGWRAEEVLWRNVVDVMTTELTVTQASEIMDGLRAGDSWSGEFQVQRRDGSTFLAAVIDTPVFDPDGALVGIIGISSDVTDRRELEQFLERFMNYGSWDLDLATGTMTWSNGLFRLMGFEPGAVKPGLARGLAVVHPDDRERVEGRLAQLQQTLEPTESVHRIVRPDGEVRWVLDRAEVVVSSENVPLKLRGTDLDITELKRAEARLQASEVRFRAGFERSPIGLVLVTTEGHIITVNPAMCGLLGRSEAELTGLSIAELTHPEDVGAARDAMARMIAGEASTYQAEKRYLRPDGQAIWVLLNASLVRDPEGRPDYVFAQVQDITDRRRAEEEARSRAAQQGAVAELGRRALSGAAVEHLVHEAVTAVTTGVNLDCAAVLVPDENADDFVVEAVVGCPAAVMHALGAVQARYTLGVGEAVSVADLGAETRFVAPQPSGRTFASSVSVIITVLGRSYGVLTAFGTEGRQFSFEDVNFVQAIADVVGTAVARRRHEVAEQRANQQERLAAVGQLAAGVAHDFNNIVSAIGLYAELLDAGQSLDDSGRDHLGAIRQQVERATSLIWQILDFAHRSPIEWGDVDLAAFLIGLLPVMRRTLPDEVDVTVHRDDGPHLVRGDATRLQQIFMNLVTNARDALGGQGELRISLSRVGPGGGAGTPAGLAHDACVLVEVVDTGRGMPPEVLGRLFEPFFTTKGVGHGTGLGMAQVHGLVGQHGGQIDVESSYGAGTKVSIWLPAIDSSPSTNPEHETRTSNVTGQRVVVVDDDDALRTALGRILESRGYVVTLASDGEEALAYLDRQSASVTAVVSDVMMPVLGGDGLASAVAKRWPGIPVVLISANPSPQSQGDAAGGPVRLNKPFTSNQLAEALRVAIGSSP